MELNTKISRNPDMLAVEMDDELVMMDATSGDYFGLNTVGAHIWNLLEQEHTIAMILDNAQQHFTEATAEQIQTDVYAFLTEMQDKNLVTVTISDA